MRERIGIVFAAAHRLLFLTGVLNFALLMLWWTTTLFDLYIWPIGMSAGSIPAQFLHAPVMLYLMLPSLFFGFLLTVFPRWLGFADLVRKQYTPIGSAFFIATIIAWCALIGGNPSWLVAALCVAALGWVIALWHLMLLLAAEMRGNKGPTWHAWSAFSALCLGLIVLMLSPAGAYLPLHFISALVLCVLTGIMFWRWWPGSTAPGLLMVLIWGFAWAPIGFALIAAGHFAELSGYAFNPGKAPVHALYIGMAGSLIIAMVTRVTQGHSGRPLDSFGRSHLDHPHHPVGFETGANISGQASRRSARIAASSFVTIQKYPENPR